MSEIDPQLALATQLASQAGLERLAKLCVGLELVSKTARKNEISTLMRDSGAIGELAAAWITRQTELEASLLQISALTGADAASKLRAAVKLRANAARDALSGRNEAANAEDPEFKPPKKWVWDLIADTEPHSETLIALDKVKGGGIRKSPLNVAKILEFDPRISGRFQLDTFAHRILFDKFELHDADLGEIAYWIGQTYDVDVGQDQVMAALVTISRRHSVHPIRRYLDKLEWDGIERLDSWLKTYAHVDDVDNMAGAYGSKFLISCVARAYEPGCEVHTVLVLAGEQGFGKSSTFKILGGEWFSDTLLKIGEKSAYEDIQGVWIHELAELDSLSKREVTTTNAFITSKGERFRPAYGRTTMFFPRQTVFCGTTNKAEFLRDPAGARRYWIRVVMSPIDLVGLRTARDQLWAEAVAAYRAGVPWHLVDAEIAAQREDAEQYQQSDPWEEQLRLYLEDKNQPVMAEQVLEHAMSIPMSKQDYTMKSRMGGVLRRLGWKSRQIRLTWLKSGSAAGRVTLYATPDRWWLDQGFVRRFVGATIAPRNH